MYGYIRAHAPELKVREQEYYRAVYCGLCRSMGKCTGQCSRMTLSYDVTFLALLRLILEGEDVELRLRRCAVHPMKKKLMADAHDTLTFCAYASAILAYHKVMDDRSDEKGKRRFRAVTATPYVRSLRRRAIKAGYADLDASVKKTMEALSALEAEHAPTVDRPADLFGELMATLVSYGLEGDPARIARSLGHRLGRWIYLMDAIDDYEEDKQLRRYNPFACLWQGSDLNDQRKEDLSRVLTAELVDMEAALDLCDADATDHRDLWGVTKNILYLGMPAAAHRVLYPDCECHAQRRGAKRKITKER